MNIRLLVIIMSILGSIKRNYGNGLFLQLDGPNAIVFLIYQQNYHVVLR